VVRNCQKYFYLFETYSNLATFFKMKIPHSKNHNTKCQLQSLRSKAVRSDGSYFPHLTIIMSHAISHCTYHRFHTDNHCSNRWLSNLALVFKMGLLHIWMNLGFKKSIQDKNTFVKAVMICKRWEPIYGFLSAWPWQRVIYCVCHIQYT